MGNLFLLEVLTTVWVDTEGASLCCCWNILYGGSDGDSGVDDSYSDDF